MQETVKWRQRQRCHQWRCW